MKVLPKKYRLAKRLGQVLDHYMDSSDTAAEIRSTELFEVVSRDEESRDEFASGTHFSRFLRDLHEEGTLGKYVSYNVDDTNNRFYQWYFRRNPKEVSASVGIDVFEGQYNYYKNSKNREASDGTKFRSAQEVYIYEELLKRSHAIVKLEYPLTVYSETVYPDFVIENKITGQKYYWEHFGMTNSENYKNKMASKVIWYRNNGYIALENGGNLIYTYYTNENNFTKDVHKVVKRILR